MILFSAIAYEDCSAAYHWHRGFSGANDSLYPREYDDFQSLVMDGSVWAAKEAGGNYLALAYASYSESNNECEIGGLMVAKAARGQGLGANIMRLVLSHALVEENLLAIPDVKIVAHVLKSNDEPRKIIEDILKFRYMRTLKIPASQLKGLRVEEDGFIHGDEYEIMLPDTLIELAEWAKSWPSGSASSNLGYVELRTGVELNDWADALKQMASQYITQKQ